jgi:hypothetical protein
MSTRRRWAQDATWGNDEKRRFAFHGDKDMYIVPHVDFVALVRNDANA